MTSLTAIGGSGTRYRTGTATSAPNDARAVAELTDERLRRHAANGGYLVLTLTPNHQERAIRELEALGATAVDADRIGIEALHAAIAARGIDWDRAILVTDAEGPAGARRARLLTAARSAATILRAQILTDRPTSSSPIRAARPLRPLVSATTSASAPRESLSLSRRSAPYGCSSRRRPESGARARGSSRADHDVH